jgi:hypothetical protein
MPIFFALLALVAGHALGWPAVSGFFSGALSWTQAGQGVFHALFFVGVAGLALTYSDRLNLSLACLVVGAVALAGLLSEDVLSIAAQGPGWKKDILDAGQRIALLVLGLARFQAVYARITRSGR